MINNTSYIVHPYAASTIPPYTPISRIYRYNANNVAFYGDLSFINDMLDILQNQFTHDEIKFHINNCSYTYTLSCKLSDECAAMFEFAMIAALTTYKKQYKELLTDPLF